MTPRKSNCYKKISGENLRESANFAPFVPFSLSRFVFLDTWSLLRSGGTAQCVSIASLALQKDCPSQIETAKT